MKKILIIPVKQLCAFMICGTLIMGTTAVTGCSETIILNDNVKENVEKANYEVVETPIQLDKEWLYPEIYSEGMVYVADIFYNLPLLDVSTVTEYYIDEEGNYYPNSTSEGILPESPNMYFKTEIGNSAGISYRGLTKDYDETNLPIRSKEYYYRDNLNDITLKVDGLNDFINNTPLSSYELLHWYITPLNDNKYICISMKAGSYGQDVVMKNISEEVLFIIDSETEKVLTFHNDEPLKSSISQLYYDDNLASVMAITNDNKIKKVNIKNNSITLEAYTEINIQGYEVYYILTDLINEGNNIVFALVDPTVDLNSLTNFGDAIRTGIYNKNTNEFTLSEPGIYATNMINDTLLTVSYNNDSYLAQITEDSTVNLIYKFQNDTGRFISTTGLINDEGNKIFITKRFVDTNAESETKFEYSFIELK